MSLGAERDVVLYDGAPVNGQTIDKVRVAHLQHAGLAPEKLCRAVRHSILVLLRAAPQTLEMALNAFIERATAHLLCESGAPAMAQYDPVRVMLAEHLYALECFADLLESRLACAVSGTPTSKSTHRRIKRELRQSGWWM